MTNDLAKRVGGTVLSSYSAIVKCKYYIMVAILSFRTHNLILFLNHDIVYWESPYHIKLSTFPIPTKICKIFSLQISQPVSANNHLPKNVSVLENNFMTHGSGWFFEVQNRALD